MIDLLYNHSSNVYSANGEDGINEYILKHLELDSGVVLEIGAWDGFFDSNCANLWSDGSYNGILIEATSKLNIAEHRLPQDGRMKIKTKEREIDVRVSILPTVHGEKVVLRLLGSGNKTLTLTNLGFPENKLKIFP